ncbi:sensor histidine kinase [Plebeiibacterium sediminum]|uniref:histidine kinase n=1 Tax=Plebeiibacterium sediminum TaxID=2992112 RepID=A0AAE3M131_9BACT|nr:HAMP domain-containing sensor histidine kinase [Plebeiobacterium sediminum]MCW3785336.1 HAMP domain-containing histidine kinase [Plebeiobacterium sediminum]
MDVKTLILLFSLASWFTFLFLLYYEITSPKKNRIIQLYAIGKLFLGFVWLLPIIGRFIPYYVSVTIGNTLLAWGCGLEVFSMAYINAKKPINYRRISIFGFISLFIFLIINTQPDNIRVGVASFVIGVIFTLGFIWILKQHNTSKRRYLAFSIYLFLAIINFIRGFTAILVDTKMSLTSKGLIQDVAFASFFLLTLSTIIFFLLLKEKDDKKILSDAKVLANTNELLKASNATKDKLFSIIAHDLRGAMGTSAQLTDLLFHQHKEFSEQERNQFLEQLVNSSNKNFELLENLLNWSRSQLKAITVEATIFSMNELLKEILSQVESMFQTKTIHIENKINSDWFVKADYEMIKVVVRNIITNAIKFSPCNSKITIEGQEDSFKYHIRFIDQGVGIQADVLKELLTPEFLHSTPGTANEKGSGIGLKLTKDFIEKNGGTISISSKVNEGSVFEISLPKG